MDHEPMALPYVPVCLGEQRRHTLEAFVPELAHLPATCAYQVLVVRLAARGLVAPKPFAEVALDREPAPHEELEGPVQSRRSDTYVARTELARDLLGGQVPR
jgi:hypothetical protein